jgi:cytochrome c biogenesis protein CcmG, thiol:disulfide interchange protein DsbE
LKRFPFRASKLFTAFFVLKNPSVNKFCRRRGRKACAQVMQIGLTVWPGVGMLHPANLMLMISKLTFVLLCVATLTAGADETLPLLTIKGQTYTNVTVTAVTASDIFFSHASGMGNAKLKDLDPKLQARFHYDAAKDALVEKQQATNNVLYRQYLSTNQPQSMHNPGFGAGAGDDDFVAPQLNARSVRGRKAPPFIIEKWLTRPSDPTGKFVMLEFWTTDSAACRQIIPQLNSFFEKYHDRLVIIGISNESEEDVRKMTDPHIEYTVAIDTQARMAQALEITAVPHCILIDPHSIVRYEGTTGYLDDGALEHFLAKYK